MPQYPIINAPGEMRRPDQVQLDRADSVTGPNFNTIASEVNRIANQFGSIYDKTVKTSEELELVDAASKYNAGLKTIRLSLSQDQATATNPEEYMKQYVERAGKLQKDIESKITPPSAFRYGGRPTVAQAFQRHVSGRAPNDANDAFKESLEIKIKTNQAMLVTEGDKLSTTIAESDDPKVRDTAQKTYEQLILSATLSGHMQPKAGAEAILKFKEVTQTKFMDVMGLRDPAKMVDMQANGDFAAVPELTQASILHKVRERKLEQQRDSDRIHNQGKDAQERLWGSWAATGQLAPDLVANAKRGFDPYITAERAIHFEKINNNVGGGNRAAVDAVMVVYGLTDGSEIYARAAQEALGDLYDNSEAGDKYIATALSHLQSDIYRARSANVAAVNLAITAAKENYRSQVVPIPNMLKPFVADLQPQDINEIAKRVRKDPARAEEIVKDVLNKRRQQSPPPDPESAEGKASRLLKGLQ